MQTLKVMSSPTAVNISLQEALEQAKTSGVLAVPSKEMILSIMEGGLVEMLVEMEAKNGRE